MTDLKREQRDGDGTNGDGDGEVRTEPTLCTSTTIAAREPERRFSGGMSCSYSGVPNSCTVPVPKRRTMRAAPSRAQNMIVIRRFSFRCAIVSTPAAGVEVG